MLHGFVRTYKIVFLLCPIIRWHSVIWYSTVSSSKLVWDSQLKTDFLSEFEGLEMVADDMLLGFVVISLIVF